MKLEDMNEINYALGHAMHKMFEIYYEKNKAYEDDPTHENARQRSIAKDDLEIMRKAVRLFADIVWRPNLEK